MSDNQLTTTETPVLPTGDEVEKAMLANESNSTTNPEELASTMFAMYFPRYVANVDQLSSNSLRRLVKALVGYPLEDFTVKSSNKLESEAFAIGRALLDAKMMMIFQTYSNNLETLQEAANSSEDTIKETNNEEGETNVV